VVAARVVGSVSEGNTAELVCRTAFSFGEGASTPEEIVEQAAKLGLGAVGITDRDGVYGLPRAHRVARSLGVRILPGALLTLSDGPGVALLARDVGGWANLTRLITEARKEMPKGWGQLPLNTLLERSTGLEAILLGEWCVERASAVQEAFGAHASLALTRRLDSHDDARWEHLSRLSSATQLPLVATCDALMHDPSRKPLQDVLTCIRKKCTLDQAGTALTANATRFLRSPEAMGRMFKAAPQALERSTEIADQCHFSLSDLRYLYPREIVPEGWTPMNWLRHQTQEGLAWRYPEGTHPKIRAQVEHELALIEKLQFPAYFLTVHDLVRFARSRQILCQGRGSAANSAVCFALGITAVDPASSSLLFERFISEERGDPPDIDVDFEHERREEVLQYVYERYGRHRAAMVNEVISYRRRSAIRDVGKVLGLDPDQIDRMAKSTHWFDGAQTDDAKLKEAGIDPRDPRVQQTIAMSGALQGMPRHVGIHTGGFTISDGPLIDLCPIEPATMANRTVIQWDKDDIDTVGFVKVDLLSLGMLTAIRKCFDLIEKHWGQHLNLASVPHDDAGVYDMLCRADTMGVFQIESRAQMSMLPRLKPRCFYDLVIQVSIVRPGPIQGGMVHPYLRRRRGEEPVTYAHPSLEPILARTLGVPIFQEQVMAMAVAVGGFTPGQADALRRAMGAWRKRGTLGPLVEKLVAGMRDNGISDEYADQICDQIRGFGEYGFPESHAASFARLVYVSAWLKHHYPGAFCASLLNSQPMGFYSARSLLDDAQRHRVRVRPLDVQHSMWDNTLEAGPDDQWDIRLGLRQIRGMSREAGLRIETARSSGGSFLSIASLQGRADLDRGALGALARADALCGLASNRRQALWTVQGLYDLPLFRGLQRPDDVVLPWPSPVDEMREDYRSLGLSLTHNPIGMVRARLDREGFVTAAQVQQLSGGRTVRVAGMVAHRQRPSTAKGVVFMTLEDETGLLNIVIKPHTFDRQRKIIVQHNLLEITAKVQRDGLSVSLLASHFSALEAPRPENLTSRDFR
jgi:error-prone DNA polymerase